MKEFELQMTNLIDNFLSINKKELGLNVCDDCVSKNKVDIRKIAREVSTTMYYFLKCKGVLGDEK